ncbi:unnamed protein product [Taenia asiatica]|uniref:tryptophan--tRNA ligase n=1 Tax=Taenia asiatica TaxID=60517 RepID=A0A158R7P4_TAEAS|nr:unnamed protein product [Taenia asiatica]
MPPEYTTTLYEEKPIAKSKVSIASWSPKMDIIAIGSPSGIVSLHRYKMGINWEVHSPDSGGVTCLAWRPDGKVLSVAYECGRLQFLNLLDGTVLHSMEFGTAVIRYLTWVSCEHNVTTKQTIFPPFESLSVFTDDLFSNRQEVSQLSKPWLDPDSKPSVLVAHFEGNTVRFYGCGFCELASLKLPIDSGFYECFMAQDFASFDYFNLTPQGLLSFNKIPSRVLGERCLPMRNISFHIAALLHSKQTWSLRNELLEIILFGYVSPQLREFFQRDWTPVAIRRAGIAMFKAYGSMKAITFQQFQYGLMRLICEASELLGCVRDRQICGCFGVAEKVVVDLIRNAGSTLQKVQELHLIVNHCSQYLRPFFHWFYGGMLDIVSPTERNLVITFVSERLRPFFVDGQLKSYQIELVEQYIRTGGVTKPVDEVLGIQTTSENYKRAKLKDIIPLPTDFETKYFPEGIFVTTNASLADLIEIQLAGRIDKLAAFGGEQPSPSELFSEPERPIPLIANVNDISQFHICHLSCLVTPPQRGPPVSSLGLQVLTGTVDRIAYVKPRDEGSVDSHDTILVFSSHPTYPYHIVDLKFIEIDTLVALIYREADASPTETLQWFVFIPLEEGLSDAPELAPLSVSLASSNLTNVLLRNPLPMSKLVTEPLQVHSLPRKPSWFTVNDERRTIFVMFDSICRVYIMERVTAVEGEGEEVDEKMACDITRVFTSTVRALSTSLMPRQPSTGSSATTKGHASPPITDTFSSRAHRLYAELVTVRQHLAHAGELSRALATNDASRQRMYHEVVKVINDALQQCGQLLQQLQRCRGEGESGKGQASEHRRAVCRSLETFLKSLQKARDEQVSTYCRRVELACRLGEISPSPHQESYFSSVIRKRGGGGVGSSGGGDTSWLFSTASQNAEALSPDSLSEAELKQLEMENAEVYLHFLSERNEVQRLGSQISEIGRLQAVVTESLIEQAEAQSTLRLASALLACGINPALESEDSSFKGRTILFPQSSVTGHCELAWILASQCTVKRLAHLPQWREKSEAAGEVGASVALFTYPLLMAADVLLYAADFVPVGADQVTHLELTRDLARVSLTFWPALRGILKSPFLKLTETPKVYNLRDPTKKMSKSMGPDSGTIWLTDPPDTIRSKVVHAQTDSVRQLTYDPVTRPGVANLMQIFAAAKGVPVQEAVEQLVKLSKVELKNAVTDVIVEELAPIQTRLTELESSGFAQKALSAGARVANLVASQNLRKIKEVRFHKLICHRPAGCLMTRDSKISKMFPRYVDTKTAFAAIALMFLLSDPVIEALPSGPRGLERVDTDLELPSIAIEQAMDEKLSQVKDFLDDYFADQKGLGGTRKRAIRLLRLGK